MSNQNLNPQSVERPTSNSSRVHPIKDEKIK